MPAGKVLRSGLAAALENRQLPFACEPDIWPRLAGIAALDEAHLLQFGKRLGGSIRARAQRFPGIAMREDHLAVVRSVVALAHEQIDAGRVSAQVLESLCFDLPEFEANEEMFTPNRLRPAALAHSASTLLLWSLTRRTTAVTARPRRSEAPQCERRAGPSNSRPACNHRSPPRARRGHSARQRLRQRASAPG